MILHIDQCSICSVLIFVCMCVFGGTASEAVEKLSNPFPKVSRNLSGQDNDGKTPRRACGSEQVHGM